MNSLINVMSGEGFDDDNALEFGEEHLGEGEEVRKEERGVESDRETADSLIDSPDLRLLMWFASTSSKLVKEKPIDRLSDLPDVLLIRILSFLGVMEAGITSVLSERWRFLWAKVPSLEFREPWLQKSKGPEFVYWVNWTLYIRKREYLEKFLVNMINYDEEFASDVDAWVKYSVTNKVKELMLLMDSRAYYTPPKMMYSCSSVTNLELKRCIIPSESTVKWESLTRLCLDDVVLNQRLIDEILSSCPVLNTLELEACEGFNRLEINSRCLIHLRVHENSDEPEDELVEISAPYVRDLDIKMFPQGEKWQIKNISSVSEASIDFFEPDDKFTDDVMVNAHEFLDEFKQVKKLYIGRLGFEVLSISSTHFRQLQQLMVQNLTLVSHSEYELSISGIIGMLASSPMLETLLLDGYNTYGENFNLDPASMVDWDGDLLHLKTIRVNNFADPTGEPLLTLARLLLRKAPALEKMRIVIDVEDKSNFANIAQKLLTYPRSSAKAQIYLNYHHK